MTDLLTHRRYAAARHLLASPSIALRTRRHVADGRIDWYGVRAERVAEAVAYLEEAQQPEFAAAA